MSALIGYEHIVGFGAHMHVHVRWKRRELATCPAPAILGLRLADQCWMGDVPSSLDATHLRTQYVYIEDCNDGSHFMAMNANMNVRGFGDYVHTPTK